MAIERRAASGTAVTTVQQDPNATHTVKSTDANSRTLFRGPESKARIFVKDHFPWLHVNPGDDWGVQGPMPEVVLTHPDGAEEYWNGEDWVTETPDSEPVEKAEVAPPNVPAGYVAHFDEETQQWVAVPGDATATPEDTGVETPQIQTV